MSKGIPTDCNTLTAHLVVSDGVAAIEFYKKAFGAVEETRIEMPETGKIMYASLKMGNSKLMLSEECKDWGSVSPLTLNGSSPVTIHFYVENVDEAFKKAIAAGATETMPVEDMFWGDRYGKLKDPFGHNWSLATHLRDMSKEEMQEAAKACMAQPVS